MESSRAGAGLTRRSLLQHGAGAIAALGVPGVLAACGGDDKSAPAKAAGGLQVDSDRVIFADYGGTVRTARVQAYFEEFQRKTGARVISADADPSKLALFAKSGRAQWDLIDLDGWDVIRFANQDTLQELPSAVTRSDLVPKEFQRWASGGYSASALIGHRTDKGDAPTSWRDFWDTDRFPGKRAVPSFAWMQVEIALLADGVAGDALYPLDLDRAFAKLDELRDSLLFYESFGQGMQYLAQGSVSMTLNTNSRVTVLKDQGLPVEPVWNEAILEPWTGAAVPKGAPHEDAAFALVDLMAQPEHQAAFAQRTYYGPNSSKALELVDDETLAKLPNAPEHAKLAVTMDMAALAEQIDEYTNRYVEWLANGS